MKFLVAIHHPIGYDGSKEDPSMGKAIDDLNIEMVNAGIRTFVGGLQPRETAKSIRTGANGDQVVTDGIYLETKEHVGGFWVLELPDMESALDWGKKANIACRAPVEVRPFH